MNCNDKAFEELTSQLPMGLTPIVSNTSFPIIDRPQIREMLNTLLNKRRRKNILIIGEPGIGKTQLISTLSHSITKLDLATLVSGTAYRGSFESKLNDIIDFSIEHKLTLFIDEIHSLYNLGLSDGGISALNILKPYLANGEITIIGATTPFELTFLENDAAFLRRFTAVKLLPISKDDVLSASEVLLSQFDIHFSDDLIIYLIELTERYFNIDRFLDGFLDLADTLDSYFVLHNNLTPQKEDLYEVEFLWENMY